jgi:hypothetical protein
MEEPNASEIHEHEAKKAPCDTFRPFDWFARLIFTPQHWRMRLGSLNS